MDKLFTSIKTYFPKSVIQFEKKYVSFTFSGGIYYQLRVQKDKVRMMATNYPAKAKKTVCQELIKKYEIEGFEINGRRIIYEEGARNPEIFTLRLEFPFESYRQLDNNDFIDDILDSCVKFHDKLIPLVNQFMKAPLGNLYKLMGADDSIQMDIGGNSFRQVDSIFSQMIFAFKEGNLDQVAQFIEEGNPPLQFNQDGSLIENELISICAASEVDLNRLDTVIKQGVDLNVKNLDKDQYTALHFCAWDGKVDAIKVLLRNDALPDIIGNDGRTALHLASANGHTEVVDILIAAGVDVNRRIPNDFDQYYSENGSSALRDALFNQYWEVVQILLNNGADIKMLSEPCIQSLEGSFNLFDVIRISNKNGIYPEGLFDDKKLSALQKEVELHAEDSSENISYLDILKRNHISNTNKLVNGILPQEHGINDLEFIDENTSNDQSNNQKISDLNLSAIDVTEESVIDIICEKIKNEKYLTNLIYVNKLISEHGFLTDNHQAYFFDSNVLISDMEMAGFLLVNMDGFYSNCIGKDTMQCVFSWDVILDIEYQDHYESSILDIIAQNGKLTIKKENSRSLRIVYYFYKYVWKYVNERFRNEHTIIWNVVWEMGINEIAFNSYDHYCNFEFIETEDSSSSEHTISESDDYKGNDDIHSATDEDDFQKSFFIDKEYEYEYALFLEIANKTGIVLNTIKVEPSADERNKLWEIVRAFAERIYEIDAESNPDPNEMNTLCFFSIVALHWCDLMVDDNEFSYQNGRFRRDTIALAFCFYLRIDRTYDYYDHVRNQFIMPHIQFSLLLWSINSIVHFGQDIFFGKFSQEDVQSARQFFLEMDKKNRENGIYGLIDPNVMPETHPIKRIWTELNLLFNNVRLPYEFIKKYIDIENYLIPSVHNLSSHPTFSNSLVYIMLLEDDKKSNLSFLDSQILHKQFPAYWTFTHDVAYITIYYVNHTGGILNDEIHNMICKQLGEWLNIDDEDQLNQSLTDILQETQTVYDADQSSERFNYIMTSIYRYLFVENESDAVKTKNYLNFILNDLLAIAEVDGYVKTEEVDMVVAMRETWGITTDNNEDEITDSDLSDQDLTKRITSEFDDKLVQFYGSNVWDREGYKLEKKPFPNVINVKSDIDLLFRKFTCDEIDLIVKKIKSTKTYFVLPFIREILFREIDLTTIKPPFWFIPICAFGNDITSILYFTQDGIYNTYESTQFLTLVAHVDTWQNLNVAPGYNGLFHVSDDDDSLSSLKIDWNNPNSGNNGAITVVEFHGNSFGATLRIVKALWDNAWKDVVDRSRNSNQFLLGPPPHLQSFETWDELLDWAKI